MSLGVVVSERSFARLASEQIATQNANQYLLLGSIVTVLVFGSAVRAAQFFITFDTTFRPFLNAVFVVELGTIFTLTEMFNYTVADGANQVFGRRERLDH
jgi:hypothetical protein